MTQSKSDKHNQRQKRSSKEALRSISPPRPYRLKQWHYPNEAYLPNHIRSPSPRPKLKSHPHLNLNPNHDSEGILRCPKLQVQTQNYFNGTTHKNKDRRFQQTFHLFKDVPFSHRFVPQYQNLRKYPGCVLLITRYSDPGEERFEWNMGGPICTTKKIPLEPSNSNRLS